MEKEPPNRLRGFPPVIDASCRMLVLGSMPGGPSLQKQQYYGNPRNHFWPLIYAVYGGTTSPSEHYEERLSFALAHGIGLWDVLAECERTGSLDSHIRKPEINHFCVCWRPIPASNGFILTDKLQRSFIIEWLYRFS